MMRRWSGRMVGALVAAGLVACGSPAAAPPAQPAVLVPAAAASGADPSLEPELLFTPDELARHIASVAHYPPTACRLERLIGTETFALLEERGGYYPVDESDDAGFTYRGALCPQPYCEGAAVWVHPSGAMVAAVEVGDQLRLFANRRRLVGHLPKAIQDFVDAVKRTREVAEVWPPRRYDDARCTTASEHARKQRYLEVDARRRCDAEFSRFWWSATRSVAIPAPHFGAAADPHDELTIDAPAGYLLELGARHADDEGYVCARLQRDTGTTIGWLPMAALTTLPQQDGATLDTAKQLAQALPATSPTWSNGLPLELGDLRLSASSSTGHLRVDLQRMVAGHICTVEADLVVTQPRLLGTGTGECSVVGLLFDNGVFLWEDGDCSGARATCTGPYLRQPPLPP